MKILRYRTGKPMNGHFSLQLHEGAQIIGYLEAWHSENGWELVMDVLLDLSKPAERRYFFLCGQGDDLGFLGEYPDTYHVGTHYSKTYASYIFDTTHLSEQERAKGAADWRKLQRAKPKDHELGRDQRYAIEHKQKDRDSRGLRAV